MILIGIGSNLPSGAGTPLATCEAALDRLRSEGIAITTLSPWYETAPVPVSDQPWFINAVAQVQTTLTATSLLNALHETEEALGRVRTVANAARVLDLDLLAYDDLIQTDAAPLLPHPRLHERAFVLMPLRDIAPDWRHPVSGLTPAAMLARLPPGQGIRPVAALKA